MAPQDLQMTINEQQLFNSASKRQKKEHSKNEAKKAQPSPIPKQKNTLEVHANGNGHIGLNAALSEVRNPQTDLFQTTEVDRNAYRPHKN